MKAFFRGLELQRREVVVKDSLKAQLMSSIKEVQLEHAHSQDKHTAQKNNEATNSLCTIIEAIFIHGLKETLVDRVSIAIGDPDQMPEPNFWSPLMVFSHRDIITQINKMSQITTDVGRCRAWIRLALNDGLLLSYFETIAQQNNALNPYYKKSAYLRDAEMMGLAQSFIGGLSSVMFDLPTNSSILNVWTNTPLLLAGIWTAPMKSCPVFAGTDVAKTLSIGDRPVADEETASLLSFASYQDSIPGSQKMLLDEDEALKIILGTPIEGSPLQSRVNLDQVGESSGAESSNAEVEKGLREVDRQDDSPPGVNDSQLFPEITDVPVRDTASLHSNMPKVANTPVDNSATKPLTVETYQSLLKSYNPSSRSENLQDLMQRFDSTSTAIPQSANSSDSGDEQISSLGFELICESTTFSIKAPEFRNMIEQLSKIVQEPGLDTQNYACRTCYQPFRIAFSRAKVCALTGVYYCPDCFSGTEWIIPARILHNWDFSRYEVSSTVAAFLNEIQHHPILDVRRINPRLYLAIEDMATIQKLRLQLNLLRGYLMTCRPPTIRSLQKQVWPREYLYEHVHLYSIADLIEIPTGILTQFLQRIIKFSQDHVISCPLCSQKGFICEICNDPAALYPFDLDTSYRCLLCKSVFHSSCKEKVEQCPKCERIKRRQAQALPESIPDNEF